MARNFRIQPQSSGLTLSDIPVTRLFCGSWTFTSPCLTAVPKQASHGRRILEGRIFPRSLALLPRGNILTSASSLNRCCIHLALDTPSNLYKRPQPFKRPKFRFKCHHPGCPFLPNFKTTLPHLGWLAHTSQKKKPLSNAQIQQTTWSCFNISINICLKYKITYLGAESF